MLAIQTIDENTVEYVVEGLNFLLALSYISFNSFTMAFSFSL